VDDRSTEPSNRTPCRSRRPLHEIIRLEEAILQRRLAGQPWRDIAEAVGVSLGYAHERYVRALERSVRQPAEELRQLEAERLDAVLVRCMSVVTNQQSSDSMALQAVDKVVRLTEVRARLLGFYPAVTRSSEQEEVRSSDEVDAAIARLLAKRREAATPP
jgi:hypothetical protein